MMEIKRQLQSKSDYIQSTFGSFILLSSPCFSSNSQNGMRRETDQTYAIANMH